MFQKHNEGMENWLWLFFFFFLCEYSNAFTEQQETYQITTPVAIMSSQSFNL